MKKFSTKFRRIIAMICAAVMLVTSVELSPYLFVRAEGESTDKAPIGVAFDNEEKVSGAGFYQHNGGYTISSELIDNDPSGRKFVRINCTPDGGTLDVRYGNFLSQAGKTSVNLDDYPYMKISYRHDVEGSPIGYEQMDIRANNEDGSQKYWTRVYVSDLSQDPDDEWKEIVYNFKDATYDVYNEAGTVDSSGQCDCNEAGYENWTGDAYSFRLDLVRNTTTYHTTMDIEYITLFATEEEALAYPNTPAKVALEEDLQNAEFTTTFANAGTVAAAEAVAGTQIQTVIDAQETASGSDATFTMSNSKFYFNSTGGVFTSDVAVTMPGQITFNFALNMTITDKTTSAPIKVVFDDAETVQGSNVEHSNYNLEKTLGADDTSGKQYMRLHATPSGSSGIYLKYHSFASQAGVSPVQLANYPYMKISYRHEVVSGSTSGSANMHIKAMNESGGQTFWAKVPVNDIRNNTADGWKELVVNFNTSKFDVYDGDGTISQSQGALNYNEGVYVWSDVTAYSFRLDFVEGGVAETNMDIEYIALFATEAEALAYTSSVDSDVEALESAAFSCKGKTITTAAAAHAELKAQIDALGLQNDYTLEEGTFTAADSIKDGSYVADVVLDPANKVQVTMTIVSPKEPIRVVFSSQSVVNKMTTAGVKSKTFVNGTDPDGKKYVRLEHDTSNGNHWVQYSNFVTQSGVESIDFDVYKYVKISYRRIITDGSDVAWEVTGIKCVPEDKTHEFQITGSDTGWMETIFDFSTAAQWKGQGETIINFSRYPSYERTVDVEYVAFFATKEEAEAYTPTIDQDMETLTGASFQAASADVSTESEAHAELSNQIAALNLQSEYTLENGQFTAATEEENGSYSVDVVFNENYQVTVTMTITKPFPAPIAWTFDNSSILQRFSGTNAKMVYEDGYLKMTTPDTKYDDGFFIAGSLSSDEQFDLGEYGYFKAKYRITGAASAPIQLYCFMADGSTSSGSAYANVEAWEGKMVEIIIKVAGSAVGETAIWIKNLETGETVTTSFYSGTRASSGKVSSIRFNLARQHNLYREAYVEYMGFFTSYEAAVAYEGAAEERIEAAVEYLESNALSMNWGLASTQEKAILNAPDAVEAGGVGCTISNVRDYKEATTAATGSITFDATLKSAEESRVVEGLTVTINKKPSEPIVWRFNDSEFVKKLDLAQVKVSVENNVMKMVSTSPLQADGFYFMVNLPEDTEAFYLEDYPYVRMKYKRDGVGAGQLFYNSDAFVAGSPSLGQFGYGQQSGDWYTTILDTGVRDFETPTTYNYNHKTGVEEQLLRKKLNGVPTTDWVGLASHFRFNFANIRNTERTLYLEYIAFFPTLEEARAYDAIEEAERLKSNAQLALKGYTGSNVDYYAGHTEEEAKETALEKLTALLSDEVTAVINKVSYTAPDSTSGTDGSLVFTATIQDKKGNNLYTTAQYTLTISSTINKEPVVFTFANPALISRVDGTNAKSMDYACMGLTDNLATSFKLSLKGTEQFYTNEDGHRFVAFKVNAEASQSKLFINDKPYDLGDIISGETVIAIDMTTGAVYKNKTIVSDETIQIPLGKVSEIGMEFNTTSATVSYMAFFATEAEALAYDGSSKELQTAITKLQAETMESAYVDAKTQKEALAVAISKVEALLSAGAELVAEETEVISYAEAKANQNGSIKFSVLIGAGSEIDSHYEYVELTMTIKAKPSQPIVWTFGGKDGLAVSQLGKGDNVTLTIEDSILHMDSTKVEDSDGFHIEVDKNNVPMDFYLQDYPYVKVKYRYESKSVGSAQFYAFSDAGTIGRTYNWGYGANTDEWGVMLWDLNENSVTVVDVDNSTLLGTQTMTDQTPYRGKPSSFRLDMGRFTTTERHAEIEYIAFFSSREEAEAYEKDYYYDAHDFNGVEYATAKDNLTTAPQTIETAVRITENQNAAMTILSNRQEDSDNYYALETTAEGKVRFVYKGEEVLLSEVSIVDSKWHQLAVTLEDGNAVLYVDGVVADTNTLDSGMSVKTPVMANDYVGETPFRGQIYYVRLFSVAQSQEQIKANAFNKEGAYTDGLLAGWFTDKLVKYEQFADVCGVNPMTLGDNYGKDGHEFLGSDYIKTEKVLTEKENTFAKTFEFWMKAPASTASGTYTILSNKTEGSSTGTTIALVNGQLQMVYNGTELFVTEGLTLSDNIWTHVAITLDDSISLYLDGVLEETYTTAYTENSASLNAYYIGASLENTKTPFIGSLSDVRIWSSVKSLEAIKANMMDYPEKANDLLASWWLDTQVYLKYTDHSSNSNTATLYSSGWYKLDSIYGDYSFGAIGDTQSYMFGNNALFLESFENLADKVEEFKMKALFHLGDVTQVDSPLEWSFAQEAFSKIEGLIPYTIVPGNHDYPSPSSGVGAEYRDLKNMNAAFPRETYFEQMDFGGAYDDVDSANIYNFLTAGGVEYIIFGLEHGPRDDVLTWVSEVLEQYPNKRAIILTHCYFEQPINGEVEGVLTTENANSSGGDFATANDGDDIWNKLVSKHNNIAMVFCGHSQNPHITYRYDESDYGTKVLQMLLDHSNVAQDFPSTQGLMTILSFTNDGKMHSYWYSPLYDAYYQTDNEITLDMYDTLYGDTGMAETRTTYAKKYDEIKEYRGETKTAPQADKYGYIFAGWYKDEDCTQPLAITDMEGSAYAKFVDKDVLTVKSQTALNSDGTLPEDKTGLRFVTTIDNKYYSQVGFKIAMQLNAQAGTYSKEIDTYNPNDPNVKLVYKQLYAIGSDNNILSYEPSVFSNSSTLFKAWTLNDIPAAQYNTNFRVKAYWVTLDGTMVEGAPSVESVSANMN